jgi:hypothetical protein
MYSYAKCKISLIVMLFQKWRKLEGKWHNILAVSKVDVMIGGGNI